MSTTRWAAVASALVTTMRARTGYRSPWSTTDGTSIPVYFSTEVFLLNDQFAGTGLVVAWPGDLDDAGGADQSGDSGQVMATMGTVHSRDETGTVHCLAFANTGAGGERMDGMVEAVLASALAIVAEVETVLRTDQTLGGTVTRWAQIGSGMQFLPYQRSGAAWSIPFDVVYSTRI